MRHVGFALAALFAFAASSPAAAQPVTGFSWAGCYIGGNGGGVRLHKNWIDPAFPPANIGDQDHTTATGGGQVGCDWQTGTLVLGARGMFDGGTIKAHSLGTEDILVTRMRGLALASGKVGIAALPNLVIYMTGGGAWTDERHLIVDPITGLAEAGARPHRQGYELGVGAAYMIWPNVSVFAEYDHIGLGNHTTSFVNFEVPPVPPVFPVRIRQTVDMVIFGVNYRFWSWSP